MPLKMQIVNDGVSKHMPPTYKYRISYSSVWNINLVLNDDIESVRKTHQKSLRLCLHSCVP